MLRIVLTFLISFAMICALPQMPSAQVLLSDLLHQVQLQNPTIRALQHDVSARRLQLAAEEVRYLPKLDLLASYNYLSKPLEINLQQLKTGVVNGTSEQNVALANDLYQEITGNPLSQEAQDRIYSRSQNILNTFYPNYNPALADQQYFVAGLFLRQPLYLGGKLKNTRELAEKEVASGEANLSLAGNEASFQVILAWLRILYINSMLQSQEKVVDALGKNLDYATSLVKNEILPPYQRNWAQIALQQARSRKQTLTGDKTNALLELNRLLSLSPDSLLQVTDSLPVFTELTATDSRVSGNQENNPLYRFVSTKTAYAATNEKLARSFRLPNLFAIGNLQLYQGALPVLMPPWMVGVELQWNIFDGFQKERRIKAAKEAYTAAKQLNDNTAADLTLSQSVLRNKLNSFREEIAVLDSSRQQAAMTTRMIRERMENLLSSPKDVNEALLLEETLAKAYYTALLGYYGVLADYFRLLGKPEQITSYLQP
ncbi:TolC family protein [Flavihumibacter petaseus]|uniref:RND-type efflux pump outer membrane protein n=1 Tax=Flavihumibacter petaseus NBRC 106054 TaxID=1220578 RepID=A0A0E9N100_9BACT|nr:TolC family protein [Flavihumibacter petaseus]GAO43514.1 hypothetical protein FPE01S_02_06190 [Flavihumibacter petaseus NBRC 106054]